MNRHFFAKQYRRFEYATIGIRYLLTQDVNIKIHLVIGLTVLILGAFLDISSQEWIIIIGCIGWVVSMEAINTIIESLCDFIHKEHHPLIGKIKDMSAAVVLFPSITSAVIGLIIFIPKLFYK